jgi:hypothetical protein
MPELMKIAAEPPELDTFSVFAVVGEKQDVVADEETLVLLKRFSRNPQIDNARAGFESAQRAEPRFHREFDFTNR